jgi:hypothetical protein
MSNGALAANGVQYKVHVTAPLNAGACVGDPSSASDKDELIVDIVSNGAQVVAPEALQVGTRDADSSTAADTKSLGSMATTDRSKSFGGSFAGKTIVITKSDRSELCIVQLGPRPVAPGDAQDPNDTPPQHFATLDDDALVYLQSTLKLTDHGSDGSPALGRKIVLYHLPGGAPAFPIPSHLTEKDEIAIKVAAPKDALVKIEVSSCDAVPGIRVLGAYADASRIGAVALRAAAAPPPTWVVRGSDRTLSCANSLVYKITVTADGKVASTTTTIPIDPIYRVSWGAAVIFDFGRPRQIALKDRPTADGTSTEKYVSQTDDYSGFRPVVLLALHLCGLNPRKWNWCDLVAPFVGADLSRLSSGFLTGIEIMPFSGIGVVGGVSLFKSDVLDPAARVKVNDTFSATGTIPKSSAFNGDGVGAFIGVAVTSDVFSQLSPAK